MGKTSLSDYIKPFDGTGYKSWKEQLKMYLISQGQDDILVKPLNSLKPEELLAYNKQSKKALGAIFFVLSKSLQSLCMEKETLVELITELDNLYAKVDDITLAIYKKNIMEFKFNERKDMQEEFIRFDTFCHRVTDNGGTLTAEEKKTFLLIALPHNYKVFISDHTAHSNVKNMDYPYIRKLCIDNYLRQKEWVTDERKGKEREAEKTNTGEKAMLGNDSQERRKNNNDKNKKKDKKKDKNNNNKESNDNKTPFKRVCYNCEGEHNWFDCKKPITAKAMNKAREMSEKYKQKHRDRRNGGKKSDVVDEVAAIGVQNTFIIDEILPSEEGFIEFQSTDDLIDRSDEFDNLHENDQLVTPEAISVTLGSPVFTTPPKLCYSLNYNEPDLTFVAPTDFIPIELDKNSDFSTQTSSISFPLHFPASKPSPNDSLGSITPPLVLSPPGLKFLPPGGMDFSTKTQNFFEKSHFLDSGSTPSAPNHHQSIQQGRLPLGQLISQGWKTTGDSPSSNKMNFGQNLSIFSKIRIFAPQNVGIFEKRLHQSIPWGRLPPGKMESPLMWTPGGRNRARLLNSHRNFLTFEEMHTIPQSGTVSKARECCHSIPGGQLPPPAILAVTCQSQVTRAAVAKFTLRKNFDLENFFEKSFIWREHQNRSISLPLHPQKLIKMPFCSSQCALSNPRNSAPPDELGGRNFESLNFSHTNMVKICTIEKEKFPECQENIPECQNLTPVTIFDMTSDDMIPRISLTDTGDTPFLCSPPYATHICPPLVPIAEEMCLVVQRTGISDFLFNPKDCAPTTEQVFGLISQQPSALNGDIPFHPTMDWAIDSGATKHMIRNPSLFISSRPYKATVSGVGGGMATAIGSVSLSLNIRRRTVKCILNDVLLVPSIPINLISVSMLEAHGFYINSKDGYNVYRRSDDFLAMTTTKMGGLYLLDQTRDNEFGMIASMEEQALIRSDIQTWHDRLGHIGMDRLKQIQSMVTGMKVDGKTGNILECKTCHLGKSHRRPIHGLQRERATEPLELVHSDLTGPMKEATFSGGRYLAIYIDDFSRKVFFYILKKKSDNFAAFKEFHKLMEVQYGNKFKLKHLHSDNGGEYTSNEFDDYCKKNGIKHTFTAPYTPEHNGVAERMIQSVVGMARCMLINSGLSLKFWGEAIRYACILHDCCPTKAVKDMTPHEAWTGNKPDVSKFHTFGCRALAMKETNKGKFTDRTKEGIYLGPSQGGDGHRLCSLESPHEFFASRSVHFYDKIEKIQ